MNGPNVTYPESFKNNTAANVPQPNDMFHQKSRAGNINVWTISAIERSVARTGKGLRGTSKMYLSFKVVSRDKYTLKNV